MITITIANKLTSLFPESRFFKTKVLIYRYLCKYNISLDARLFSSFNIIGIENIEIGKDTFIGHETLIIGASDSMVKIGNYVDISSRVSIVTGTHKIDLHGTRIAGEGLSENIIIEDGVWIGFGSIIMPGITIGKKSIVAAGSVVISDVPDNCMVAGNPAVIKKRFS
jgi:maltose O-acetyltransferase